MNIYFLLFLIPLLILIYFYLKEEYEIHKYIHNNKFNKYKISRESSILIAKKIRLDFNSDLKTFKHLNVNSRPFLRESTLFLLRHKEGLCGEGTRVIIRILNKLGYNATRITLYSKDLRSAHTLVSIKIDNQDFLVDSLNSENETHETIRDNIISTSDFDIVEYGKHYYSGRRQASRTYFLEKYWLYSFEAVPFTKILKLAGLNLRIFNHSRPYRHVSSIAEQPYLSTTLIYSFLCAGLVLFFI